LIDLANTFTITLVQAHACVEDPLAGSIIGGQDEDTREPVPGLAIGPLPRFAIIGTSENRSAAIIVTSVRTSAETTADTTKS